MVDTTPRQAAKLAATSCADPLSWFEMLDEEAVSVLEDDWVLVEVPVLVPGPGLVSDVPLPGVTVPAPTDVDDEPDEVVVAELPEVDKSPFLENVRPSYAAFMVPVSSKMPKCDSTVVVSSACSSL